MARKRGRQANGRKGGNYEQKLARVRLAVGERRQLVESEAEAVQIGQAAGLGKKLARVKPFLRKLGLWGLEADPPPTYNESLFMR